MYMIRELKREDRPRERLLQHGETVLHTHELIAIILRTGSKDESVIDVSKRLFHQYDSLKALAHAPINEYRQIRGIGVSKAIELKAAFELGRRSVQEVFDKQIALHNPEQIYHFLKDQYEMKTQEHLIALFLNTKGQLIKKEVLFIGSLNASLIHPRTIFRSAVQHSAAAMILCHNHPSGDPTPSHHDIDMTKRIVESSDMMDIPLMDHIIIGRDKYFSFKEKGVI
jgi:DNA repair protein RadC